MIRNQWYVILESSEVKAKKAGRGKLALGKKWCYGAIRRARYIAWATKCPHMSAPPQPRQDRRRPYRLPVPRLRIRRQRILRLPASPWGKTAKPPKVLKADVYPTHESNDFIWIYWGEPNEDLQPPVFFESITDDFSYISFHEPWDVHYSRMAENQLDVCHLPFVHYNTIGRGGRKIVEGPVVQHDGQRMNIWVFNRVDDGSPPRPVEELGAAAFLSLSTVPVPQHMAQLDCR